MIYIKLYLYYCKTTKFKKLLKLNFKTMFHLKKKLTRFSNYFLEKYNKQKTLGVKVLFLTKIKIIKAKNKMIINNFLTFYFKIHHYFAKIKSLKKEEKKRDEKEPKR